MNSKISVSVQALRHSGERRYPDKRFWIPASAGMTDMMDERVQKIQITLAVLIALTAAPLKAEVQVSVELEKSRISLGQSVALTVSVSGSGGGRGEPKIAIPPGLDA